MRGRRVSDETAGMVRELRRRGLSLRKIAQRAKISKSSVYRLTKGISWEQESVQPKSIEMEKIVTGDETEWAARRALALRVPRAKLQAAHEDRTWMDVAQAYFMQTRGICPLRPRDAMQEQHMRVTVQDKEDSELDQAEAYVKQMRYASKLYECVDFFNLLDAMRSEDPLEKYHELRKEALSSAVMMLRLNKLRRSS
jgi:AraC-like DNA-binding protein